MPAAEDGGRVVLAAVLLPRSEPLASGAPREPESRGIYSAGRGVEWSRFAYLVPPVQRGILSRVSRLEFSREPARAVLPMAREYVRRQRAEMTTNEYHQPTIMGMGTCLKSLVNRDGLWSNLRRACP